MNLSHLTGEELDLSGLKAVEVETNSTTVVLHHLREVERRRHYSTHKFESLHSYAVQYYGYSEDQAWRRINAMRMIRDIPEVEAKVQSGDLTLSHLNKASAMFRREKKANRPRTIEAKLHVLDEIANKPLREVEKILEQETYAPLPEKKADPITLGQFDVPIQARLKRLLEIRNLQVADLGSLIDQLSELGLDKWDLERKAKRAEAHDQKKAIAQPENRTSNDAARPATSRKSEGGRVANAKTKYALILRDRGKCVNCGSTRNLQFDHIVPFSMGGKTEVSNMRVLCRSCNQRAAIEKLGMKKMGHYLRSPHQIYH